MLDHHVTEIKDLINTALRLAEIAQCCGKYTRDTDRQRNIELPVWNHAIPVIPHKSYKF